MRLWAAPALRNPGDRIAVRVHHSPSCCNACRQRIERALSKQGSADSINCALAIALLWAVHPLLTESVTNIAGRADLLAALAVLSGLRRAGATHR